MDNNMKNNNIDDNCNYNDNDMILLIPLYLLSIYIGNVTLLTFTRCIRFNQCFISIFLMIARMSYY